MQNNGTTKCKIVLLGDQSVGKTSIINRFIFDNFTGNEQPTVGVDFVSKSVTVDNKILRMQLWDTAGQERFHSLIPSYIKDCSAAVIIYDVTNSNSFNNLGKWIDNVRQVRGQQALIMILGNKSDLTPQRAIENSLAQNKIKELGLNYKQVSAKTGNNIKEFFKQLATVIAGGNKKNREQEINTDQSKNPANNGQDNVNLTVDNQKKSKQKKNCCA